jgi:hypothetical protein
MNFGLYLPLLVALAFCQHLSQRQANDAGRLLPAQPPPDWPV